MLKNSLFQPSLSFCFSTFLPFSASVAAFLFSLFQLPFLSLQRSLSSCFFFQPYLFKVQPFTCCSLTQPKKPKRFLAFQPKRFCFSSATLSSCFFSALFFSDSAQKCYIQPKTFFLFFSLGCPLFFSPKYFFSVQTFFSFSA